MSPQGWVVVGVLAYLALFVIGSWVGSVLRGTHGTQARPAPRVEVVRDEQLDISAAIKRGQR